MTHRHHRLIEQHVKELSHEVIGLATVTKVTHAHKVVNFGALISVSSRFVCILANFPLHHHASYIRQTLRLLASLL